MLSKSYPDNEILNKFGFSQDDWRQLNEVDRAEVAAAHDANEEDEVNRLAYEAGFLTEDEYLAAVTK